jgi:hypothetical protein
MEKYLSYLYNYDRRDKGKSLIICLSIIFLVIAYRIGSGKIYDDFERFYGDKSFLPKLAEIANSLYNVWDYIVCFLVLIIATAWLKSSNDEWMQKTMDKMREEEERKQKEEQAKQKQQLETIKEENEEEA